MKARNSLILLLGVLGGLLLTGCAKPSGDYFLVSTETARLHEGSFDFTMDLDDTTCRYSTTLAARVVTSRVPGNALAFDIHVTSPIGETTIERGTFPLYPADGVRARAGSGSLVDFAWPWRTGFQVSGAETGRWRISVTPTDPDLLDALYGLGFSYEVMPWEKEN